MTDAKCSISNCNRPADVLEMCKAHYQRVRKFGDARASVPVRDRAKIGEPLAFLKRTFSMHTDECILWPYSRSGDGRAMIWVENRLVMAYRIACAHAHGPAPENKQLAAHSCGNGHLGCINHRHLRWANSRDNQMDRVDHDSHNRGERHGMARLSEADVISIRRKAAEGKIHRQLAEEYGVSQTHISCIVRRERWSWL